MGSSGRYSKWAKTCVLMKHQQLRQHIPMTLKMNRESLDKMLKLHGMVYIKPCCGSKGKGVIKVERKKEKKGKVLYQYHFNSNQRRFDSFNSLFASINKVKLGRAYLIQKGIHMARYNNRPFDLRVMVQMNPQGKWEYTGSVARVAHPGKAVTNGSQGATIHTLEEVLSRYGSSKTVNQMRGVVRHLGLQVAKELKKRYPELKEAGSDIALDANLKPWILEVNIRPELKPFSKLKNKSMYLKMLHIRRTVRKRGL
jgi:hypothetical protein